MQPAVGAITPDRGAASSGACRSVALQGARKCISGSWVADSVGFAQSRDGTDSAGEIRTVLVTKSPRRTT